MPENSPTFAQRIRSEFYGFKTLKKKNPQLFHFCAIGLIVMGVLWVWERFHGNAELQAKIATQTQQIQLLETQLTPFKTIALEKYPGELTSALAKLLDDLHKFELKLAHADRQIRTFVAEIQFDVQAHWLDGKIPDPSKLIQLGAGDMKSGGVELHMNDSTFVAVDFYGCANLTYADKGNNITTISYLTTASSGDVFGKLPESIEGISKLTFDGHVSKGLLAETKIFIHGLRVIFFVNGKKSFKIEGKELGSLDLVSGALRANLQQEIPVDRTSL